MGMMTRTWLAGSLLALLGGCASQATPQTAAEAFNCNALNRAVVSADTGFTEIKGRLNDNRLMRSWQTDTQAFHNACQILSSQRPEHYVCLGPLQSSDPRGALVKGSEIITQCLGETWQPHRSSSDRFEFTHQDSAAVVTLETFINDRAQRMGTLSIYQNATDAAPLAGES
jgi:hypothetical protein